MKFNKKLNEEEYAKVVLMSCELTARRYGELPTQNPRSRLIHHTLRYLRDLRRRNIQFIPN